MARNQAIPGDFINDTSAESKFSSYLTVNLRNFSKMALIGGYTGQRETLMLWRDLDLKLCIKKHA
jgi:hypothetical protein